MMQKSVFVFIRCHKYSRGKTMAKLYEKQIQVSFLFNVHVDDNAIVQLGNDEEVKEMDLALLRAFLTDKTNLIHLFADSIAMDIGFLYSDELSALFGYPDVPYEKLFEPSIDALAGDIGKVWRDIRDDPQSDLSRCLEGVEACFETKLVAAHLNVL